MTDLVKNEHGIISIDTNGISLIQKDGEVFIFSGEAESKLSMWLSFLEFVKEADKEIRSKISRAMDVENTKLVRGEEMVVYKRISGTKYAIEDVEAAKDFIVQDVKYSPNTKLIDEYYESTGEMPDGIALKERSQTVVIKTQSEKDEAE